MAYKLVVSEEAYKDIDGIVHYIAAELVNPIAAASFLDDEAKKVFIVRIVYGGRNYVDTDNFRYVETIIRLKRKDS